MLDCSISLIKDNPKTLNRSLSKVQNGINIIYSNCISHIKIDKDTLKTNKYDTLLYNEDNNIAIILQKDGKIKKQELIEKVPENSINEIKFTRLHNSDIEKKDQFEILFCNDDEDLDNTIKDVINAGKDRCYYYTDVRFLFQMGYINKSGYPMIILEKEGLGMIKFDNILIFIDKNYYRNNIPVWEIIEKYGIMLKMREELKFKPKKRVKNFKI